LNAHSITSEKEQAIVSPLWKKARLLMEQPCKPFILWLLTGKVGARVNPEISQISGCTWLEKQRSWFESSNFYFSGFARDPNAKIIKVSNRTGNFQP
jgi:hypothetical protein